VTGNAGQSDYAYANSFMDYFVELRNQLTTDQKRSGKTLSFNWPLWREGGMHIDKQMEVFLEKTTGIRVMETETGLDTFVKGLANNKNQILVLEGDRQKVRRTLGITDIKDNTVKAPESGATVEIPLEENARDQELYTLLKNDLLQMVIRTLRIKEEIFSYDVEMTEFGFDSISLGQFFRDISERYSIELNPSIFFEYPTFNALSQYLSEEYKDQMAKHFQKDLEKILPHVLPGDLNPSSMADNGSSTKTSPSDILVPMQTEGNKLPIFAMPGAGGGVLSLRPLSLALGNTQPFYGLQAVGFDGKTPPLESIEESAKIYIAALKTIQNAGPYTLLGYSNGGVVAYEMAKTLLEQGEKISSLILVESLCPLVRVTDVIEELVDVSNNFMRAMGSNLILDVKQLKQVPEEKRCEYLYDIMTAHGLKLTKEQFTTSYNVSTTSDRSCRIYRPSKLSYTIDASLYRAIEGYPDMPEDYGWNQLLLNPIRVYDIKANHFSIIDKDPVREIAKEINLSVKKKKPFLTPIFTES
jgi:thioesterase domain-containing protein/acyl carrier protein